VEAGPTGLGGARIQYDEYHYQAPASNFLTLIVELTAAGAEVDVNIQPLTADSLQGYDVLWVNYGDLALSDAELEAVSEWLLSGGAALVTGENNPAAASTASIFGSEYASGSCSSNETGNVYPHPISTGVDTIWIPWTCVHWMPGDGATVVAEDISNQAIVVAQEQGYGKMVLISTYGFEDWHIPYADNLTLGINTFSGLAAPTYSDVPWLSAEPSSGMIEDHAEMEISVGFDARQLPVGEYTASLAIENNDPDQDNPLIVPVALTVVAAEPLVALEPITQTASAAPGETVTYTLTVQNMGNVPDSYTLDATGEWEVSLPVTTTGVLQPGESFEVEVSVSIPTGATDGSSDTATVTAASAEYDVTASAELVTTAILPEWEVYLPEVSSGYSPP
jgi:hypothetical protein